MAEEMYPGRIEIAYAADDFERIASAGKLIAAIGIENGYVLGRDLSLLQTYYDLGARYLGLAHNGHNDIADSAAPREALGDAPSEHDGISAFGETVVAEMNRLGIMVDVSHISKAAMLDAVRPVAGAGDRLALERPCVGRPSTETSMTKQFARAPRQRGRDADGGAGVVHQCNGRIAQRRDPDLEGRAWGRPSRSSRPRPPV